MQARLNTRIFRIGLSIAVIWIIGISAFGLISGSAENYLYNKVLDSKCGTADANDHEGKEMMCRASYTTVYSYWEIILQGNPALMIAKYVLIPLALMLFIMAYWVDATRGINLLGKKYLDWIKGAPT